MIFKKIKKLISPTLLVSHDGSFHSDDIFACATLFLVLEKKNEKGKVCRTRNEEKIKKGDYVFDVGGIYDPEKNRFDHHQKGGAGIRENGIPYSSFGLVWKKYGKKLCQDEEVAKILDNNLVSPIDAFDNGVDLFEVKNTIAPYLIQHFFLAMRPSVHEKNKKSNLNMFLKSVKIAQEILKREIVHAQEAVFLEKKLENIYNKLSDKRILIMEEDLHNDDILYKFKELLFVIYPRRSDDLWAVRAVRKNPRNFENRKNLPKEWAGKRNEEMVNVTNVSDAVFCHNALFLAVAKSKEGAVKLAQIALSA
jgi:uncharacterized UPF0160 family protein